MFVKVDNFAIGRILQGKSGGGIVINAFENQNIFGARLKFKKLIKVNNFKVALNFRRRSSVCYNQRGYVKSSCANLADSLNGVINRHNRQKRNGYSFGNKIFNNASVLLFTYVANKFDKSFHNLRLSKFYLANNTHSLKFLTSGSSPKE